MNFGAETSFGFGGSGGGGTSFSSANDGLSAAGTTVKLGQTVGQGGNPAILLEPREIPMAGFALTFPGTNGTLGINGTGLLDLTQDLTGSQGFAAINMPIVWNTSATVDAIHIAITATAVGAGSHVINILQDGVARFIVDESAGLLHLYNTGLQILGFETTGGISIDGGVPQNNRFGFSTGFGFLPSNTNTAGTAIDFGSNAGTSLTTGEFNLLQTIFTFVPSSGNATFNELHFNSLFNQSAGGTGISRTIFIDPAFNAVVDYRAIEVAQGKSIFNGPVSINTSAVPTAGLFLGAGTATANTAATKFQAGGVLLGTPEAGALEFNDANLFITVGATRQTILSEIGVTASVLNTVTNKIQVSVGGVTLFILASTSGI